MPISSKSKWITLKKVEGHDIASDFDLSLDREQQRQILLNKYSNVNSLEALNG